MNTSNNVTGYIDELIERYPVLKENKNSILNAYSIIEQSYINNGKLLIAGNGGSAADSEHIAGELMKSFKLNRNVSSDFAQKLISVDADRGKLLAENLQRTLTAIPLVSHSALSTAYINDVDGLGVFAQQLFGFGQKGDVFLAISTSGNSENVLRAAVVARAMDIKVIGLTGKQGGKLAEIADETIQVPETETFKIQELHLPVYHCLCLMLEERFFA